VTCPRCGATISATASSCPTCGAAVDGGAGALPGAPDGPGGPRPPSPPPGPGLSSETRNWALAAHLSAFLGAWIALAFVGPLVVWLLKREEHPYIDHHAREALNFNLSVLLYGVVLAILAIPIGVLTLGLGLLPVILLFGALALGWLVLTIIAAVAASNGEAYRYPLTVRLVR
jgi:uncharacterized protein